MLEVETTDKKVLNDALKQLAQKYPEGVIMGAEPFETKTSKLEEGGWVPSVKEGYHITLERKKKE